MDLVLLEKLLSECSVSGAESRAADIIAEYLSSKCCIRRDGMGNVFATVNSSAEKQIGITAHLDEIGFQVTYIDADGYVFVRPNGGVDKMCLPGTQVRIHSERTGSFIDGVIGKTPIHILKPEDRNRSFEIDELWVDTGMEASKIKHMICVGDYVSFRPNFMRIGNTKITSKGLDDKVGVYIIAEVIHRLDLLNISVGITIIATTQEELGCKGAKVCLNNLTPDLAICVDLGIATDVPNISKRKYGDILLGGGVIITRHTDNSKEISLFAEQIAGLKNIPHQLSAHHTSTGGTDTQSLQLTGHGCQTLLLSIPSRYMHTQVEMCDLRDMEAAIELILSIIENFDKHTKI